MIPLVAKFGRERVDAAALKHAGYPAPWIDSYIVAGKLKTVLSQPM